MSDDDRPPGLTIRVIYEDLPDLIEIEARVVFGDWSALACACHQARQSFGEGAHGLHAR